MNRAGRVTAVLGFFALVLGLGIFATMYWVRHQPPNLDYTVGHRTGQPVHLTLQAVGAMGTGYTHPAWVSYWAKNPQGTWIHSTQFEVPTYTKIDVTILNYDGGAALRNQAIGRVTGTLSGYMTVNGKKVKDITPSTGYGESHTFTVPGLGLNVPLPSVNSNDPTFCTQSPCTPNHVHNTITFSFMSGAPRQYHWQCFFPCAAGYLDGNGGPMQTLGYMDGYLKVQPEPGHPLQVGA
jgi:hypothetical protein